MMQIKKILLVDDEPSVRNPINLSLEAEGYQVVESESASTAKQAFDEDSFSVVILDMDMPPGESAHSEGLEVLNWLKVYHPNILSIVLIGENSETGAYESLREGAFDFLEKPVSESALLIAVKRAFAFYQYNAKLKENENLQKISINVPLGQGVKPIRNQAEETMLRQVLAETQFNVHEAARRLGLKRENIYYLIKKYHIERLDFDSSG